MPSGNYIEGLLSRLPSDVVPKDISQAISEVDWDDWWPRLVLYAEGKMNARQWTSVVEAKELGVEADDIVMLAIEKALSGRRRWYPEKMSLFDFLCAVTSSEISNFFQKAENRYFHSSNTNKIESTSATPESALSKSEQVDKMLKMFKDDKLLFEVAKLMIDGVDKPSTIALALKIDVETVYNIRRRLRRRIQEEISSLREKDNR